MDLVESETVGDWVLPDGSSGQFYFNVGSGDNNISDTDGEWFTTDSNEWDASGSFTTSGDDSTIKIASTN